MPATLSCTISKIATIPNKVNADMIAEYRKYMCDDGASERHQNNALKAVIAYAKFLGENTTFYGVGQNREPVLFIAGIHLPAQDEGVRVGERFKDISPCLFIFSHRPIHLSVGSFDEAVH